MKENSQVDVAVVGSGPAGITAALYAKRKELKVRLFEAEALGGQAADALWVENYPGIEGLRGDELTQRMADHLKQFGVEVEEAAEVTSIRKKNSYFELSVNRGEETVKAKAVILCTGSKNKTLNVPGEKELYGKGVSYCATCDGPAFKGKTVAVVGAGNSGANAAVFFAGICKKVFLVEAGERPCFDMVYGKRLKEAGVEVLLSSLAKSIEGKDRVEAVSVEDTKTGKTKKVAVDGVFVYIGFNPMNKLAKSLGLKLGKKGYVQVNEGNGTSLPGVFAAGDITGQVAQIVVAAGSGAIAATSAFEFAKGLK